MATIKKIILLALTALIMVGCGIKEKDNGEIIVSDYYNQHSVDNPYIQILDSCEYICWNLRMSHKGNCRFCKERDSIKWEKHKKELEDIITNTLK